MSSTSEREGGVVWARGGLEPGKSTGQAPVTGEQRGKEAVVKEQGNLLAECLEVTSRCFCFQ